MRRTGFVVVMGLAACTPGALAVDVIDGRLTESVRVHQIGYVSRDLVVGVRLVSFSDQGLVELRLSHFQQIGFASIP